MIRAAAVTVALLLSACTPKPEPPVVVYREAPRPELPPECNPKSDPKWLHLPQGGAKASQVIRNYAENRTRFSRLAARRAICGAALRP